MFIQIADDVRFIKNISLVFHWWYILCLLACENYFPFQNKVQWPEWLSFTYIQDNDLLMYSLNNKYALMLALIALWFSGGNTITLNYFSYLIGIL